MENHRHQTRHDAAAAHGQGTVVEIRINYGYNVYRSRN